MQVMRKELLTLGVGVREIMAEVTLSKYRKLEEAVYA